jgi:hypothetical protein
MIGDACGRLVINHYVIQFLYNSYKLIDVLCKYNVITDCVNM